MKYTFNCYGHENITAKHKTTLEFTKDKDVSLRGDCIIGVKANFSLPLLKKFIKNKINQYNKLINKKTIETIPIKIIIKINNIEEEINGYLNPDFNDSNEMVVRKTDFISERTFATGANKAAFEINRNLVGFLKGKNNKIRVIIE